MQFQTKNSKVQEKLKHLPAKPGCYLFFDAKGDILYVGKAILLRNRVRSYFQSSANLSHRISRMVRKIEDLEWFVVESELEALILECNLIKKHRPPYNVRLRDDKQYPYIVITKETFPRVLFTRKILKNGSKYFGPFTNVRAVRETLALLHQLFPLIPCGKSWSGKPERKPCIYYYMGQSLAPCAGLVTPNVYDQVIQQVQKLLSGKDEGLIDELKKKMEEAAESLEFEKAARYRDRIQALQMILQKQKVLSTDPIDRDVIALVKNEQGTAIEMLYIRSGKLIGQRPFFLEGTSDLSASEIIQEFLKQYYEQAPEVPREILLPVEIEERLIVKQWLQNKRGSAISIEVPQKGEKSRLLELASENAKQALATFGLENSSEHLWAEQAMIQLQEELSLPQLPLRIEGYDISNIQGKAPVGSMVVFENGKTAKSEYRKFKIRYHPESPNDFAMMHEVLSRRLKAYLDKDPKFHVIPDLILIDGGQGQLMAALKARDALGFMIPMIGLAKKQEIIFVPIEVEGAEKQNEKKLENILPLTKEYEYPTIPLKHYEFRQIKLPLRSSGLILLRRLRDEAHRFAIGFHRKERSGRMKDSIMDDIPGIGPHRKKMLLQTFGSLEAITKASIEELASVPTITKQIAEKIHAFLKVSHP